MIRKKILIIGAGFTGLSSAYFILKNQPQASITILDSNRQAGGLATGFRQSNWQWTVENFYHHIFQTDKDILNFLTQVGWRKQLKFYQPITSTWIKNKIIKFDSGLDVLTYPYLSLASRFRLGIGLAGLKLIANGQWLERYLLTQSLPKIIGYQGYRQIFQPLVKSKFGKSADEVNLTWFWARIKSRSRKLGYYDGGFQKLADRLKSYLEKRGVQFKFKQKIIGLDSNHQGFTATSQGKNHYQADFVIVTTGPARWWLNSVLKDDYQKNWQDKKYLGSQTLLLRLKTNLLAKTYWLNINNSSYPFLMVAEHTNMVPAKYYNNEHLVYVGNYLDSNHPFWSKSPSQLLKIFYPYLKRINPLFKSQNIIDVYKFEAPISQPVIGRNYSKIIPPLESSRKNLFIANIFQVYPYDRGINYAFRLGRQVSQLLAPCLTGQR